METLFLSFWAFQRVWEAFRKSQIFWGQLHHKKVQKRQFFLWVQLCTGCPKSSTPFKTAGCNESKNLSKTIKKFTIFDDLKFANILKLLWCLNFNKGQSLNSAEKAKFAQFPSFDIFKLIKIHLQFFKFNHLALLVDWQQQFA